MEVRHLKSNIDNREMLLSRIVEFTEEYIQIVVDNKVKPYYMGTNKGAGLRDYAIGENGEDLDDILKIYKDHVLQEGLQTLHGNNFVYPCCSSTFSSAIASLLVSLTNSFPGKFLLCPGAVRMENIIIEWVAGLFRQC
ncbi:uncharacterized protein LOC144350763 [Saccoglossus kowalevskii]